MAVAARTNAPMLFAATLNQVDRDGGYTGWTAQRFVEEMQGYATRYGCRSPLFPCLDHGGPWLKDQHTRDNLPLEQAMAEVKASLTACLAAGYSLLHIDPTVDRTLAPGQPPALANRGGPHRRTDRARRARTRQRLGLPPVDYEVGTEEVHGGLVDVANFRRFLQLLAEALDARGLRHAWPCFVVAQVGTDLHTTFFDAGVAAQLTEIVRPYGSLLKGHYSDWVENPEAYPAAGHGRGQRRPRVYGRGVYRAAGAGAARGCGCAPIAAWRRPASWPRWSRPWTPQAGGASGCSRTKWAGRWPNWRADRRLWLVQTSARYIWAEPQVVAARRNLYAHLVARHARPARLCRRPGRAGH